MHIRIRERIEDRLRREAGTIRKDHGGRIRFVLAYPNAYRVGMSNLGFQGIYGLLNAEADLVCERTFLPDPDELGLYERSRTPLSAWESCRPVSDFDILAFSVAYENDYPAVLRMLDLAGMPRRARDRGTGHPLVVMGGICTAYNPEPMADFFDLVFIGEVENSLPRFLDRLRKGPEDRDKLLSDAAAIPGLYVPSLFDERYEDRRFLEKRLRSGLPARVRAGAPADLARSRFRSAIRTTESEFSDMGLVEAMRGCPWSCRFCVASHVYRPVRYRDRSDLEDLVGDLSERFGRVGLIGPSLSEHRDAVDLVAHPDIDFSISSLRAWGRSDALIQNLARKKVRSLSIAPEAGSQRLRDLVGKRLREEDILGAAGAILGRGIANLRLYFMIGLPGEKEADVQAIADLVRRIRDLEKKGRIVLTVSPFIPKPFTPFQWMPMAREAVLKKRIGLLGRAIRGLRRTSLRHDGLRRAVTEAFLARADRRAGAVVSGLADGLSLRRAAGKAGIDLDRELHDVRDLDDPMPWEFIEGAVGRDSLVREARAVQEAFGL